MGRSAPALERGSGGIGKWLLAGIVLVVLALGVMWSKRQQPQPPGPPKPVPAAPQPSPRADPLQPQSLLQAGIPVSVKREFDGADGDANGYLTPDEVKGRFSFIERNFALVDSDRDGRISVDEFWQLRRKQRAVRPRQ